MAYGSISDHAQRAQIGHAPMYMFVPKLANNLPRPLVRWFIIVPNSFVSSYQSQLDLVSDEEASLTLRGKKNLVASSSQVPFYLRVCGRCGQSIGGREPLVL